MRRQAATPGDMEGLWEGNNQPQERSQSPTKWPQQDSLVHIVIWSNFSGSFCTKSEVT